MEAEKERKANKWEREREKTKASRLPTMDKRKQAGQASCAVQTVCNISFNFQIECKHSVWVCVHYVDVTTQNGT